MKTPFSPIITVAAVTGLLLTTVPGHARAYGTTAGGRSYAAGPRGVAVSGPNGAAAAGRYGAAAVGTGGAVVATRPVAKPLPAGYIRTVPVGYKTVVYGGYSCMYVGGVYYRPVIYGGDTVYVVVR